MTTKYDIGDVVKIKAKVTNISINNDAQIIYRLEIPLGREEHIEDVDILYLPEEKIEEDKE